MGPEPGSYEVTAPQAGGAWAASTPSRQIKIQALRRSHAESDSSRGGLVHYRSHTYTGRCIIIE